MYDHIERMIKGYQQRLLANRRRIRALQSGRGRIYNGRIDVTRSTIGMTRDQNRNLLASISILRRHLRNA